MAKHKFWCKLKKTINATPATDNRVSRFKKKHSPTHTNPDHQSSFISFIHLLWFIVSSLFNLHAWQFFAQPLSKSRLVYLLVSHPPLHTQYISLSNHCHNLLESVTSAYVCPYTRVCGSLIMLFLPNFKMYFDVLKYSQFFCLVDDIFAKCLEWSTQCQLFYTCSCYSVVSRLMMCTSILLFSWLLLLLSYCYFAPVELPSIVITMSVCLSRRTLESHVAELHQFFACCVRP